jgi:hypothetical protein
MILASEIFLMFLKFKVCWFWVGGMHAEFW